MVAEKYFESLCKIQTVSHVGVEDFVDKFNFMYTTSLFLICISTVTVCKYVFTPISCYLSFNAGGDKLNDFVKNYCWVFGTIPISYNRSFPKIKDHWKDEEKYKILYYQWVPFILCLQCFMFYLPHIIWNILCNKLSGTNLCNLISNANRILESSDISREENMIKFVTKTIQMTLNFQKFAHSWRLSWLFPDSHKYRINNHHSSLNSWTISIGYILFKLIYFANSIFQLFFIRRFLQLSSVWSLGSHALQNLFNGTDYPVNEAVFPRIGYCLVPLRHVGSRSNTITAECILPANMLNENVFVVIWFWIIGLCFFNAFSTMHWIYNFINKTSFRDQYIRRFLLLNNKMKGYDKWHESVFQKFIKNFVCLDSVFLLDMFCINSGYPLTSKIVCELWDNYLNEEKVSLENVRSDKMNPDDTGASGDKGLLMIPNGRSKPSAPPPVPGNSIDSESVFI